MLSVTDILLPWEDKNGMQVGFDIGIESGGIILQGGGGNSVMQVGINVGNESDGNRFTVGAYSGDTGSYWYWK